jgi:hypothetical protein
MAGWTERRRKVRNSICLIHCLWTRWFVATVRSKSLLLIYRKERF